MTDVATEIKLNRSGHYSYQQVCQAAFIVHVNDDGTVNVAGYNHTGDHLRREEVKIGPIDGVDGEFHLNRDCPWNR